MLRSTVLCIVTELNTWSASVVYKDGAEEKHDYFIFGVRYVEAQNAKKKSLKILFTCFWGRRLTKILLKLVCSFGENVKYNHLQPCIDRRFFLALV
jgi:hypothetical protein